MKDRRYRNLLSIGILLFFILLSISSKNFASSIQIKSMQVSRSVNHWRLVFHSTGPIRYDEFQLSKPLRFVFDIRDVTQNLRISQVALSGTPIEEIRSAIHANDRLRIVLVMAHPVKIHSFVLTPKKNHRDYQLVVDLTNIAGNLSPHGMPPPDKAMGFPDIHIHALKHLLARYHKKIMTTKERASRNKENISVTRNAAPSHGKDVIVVIDPGHGGKDPGATGPGGHHEKTIVLAIAKDLQRDINQQSGFKAMLTRTGDYYITLRQRLAIAREDHADMFISIHADIWKNHYAEGASVFALSQRGATSEAARWLAARENASELMGGVNLADKNHLLKSVLINLSQTATIGSSLKIGTDIIHFLRKVTAMHHPHVEQAAFVVLKSPDIPSLLVETGFLSNMNEEQKLINPSYQYHLARAIMHGIVDYFDHEPPRGTWLAIHRGRRSRYANS